MKGSDQGFDNGGLEVFQGRVAKKVEHLVGYGMAYLDKGGFRRVWAQIFQKCALGFEMAEGS